MTLLRGKLRAGVLRGKSGGVDFFEKKGGVGSFFEEKKEAGSFYEKNGAGSFSAERNMGLGIFLEEEAEILWALKSPITRSRYPINSGPPLLVGRASLVIHPDTKFGILSIICFS